MSDDRITVRATARQWRRIADALDFYAHLTEQVGDDVEALWARRHRDQLRQGVAEKVGGTNGI